MEVKTIAREIHTVGELRRVLEPITDEAELSLSVSVTVYIDLECGTRVRIRED